MSYDVSEKPEDALDLGPDDQDQNQPTEPESKLCPRCSTYDMDAGRNICEHCEDEIAEENPDGRWVQAHGCWLYE